jgi:hypothetical protein
VSAASTADPSPHARSAAAWLGGQAGGLVERLVVMDGGLEPGEEPVGEWPATAQRTLLPLE